MLLRLLLPPFRRVEVLAVIVVGSRDPVPVLVVLLPLLPVSMRQGVGGDIVEEWWPFILVLRWVLRWWLLLSSDVGPVIVAIL